MLSHLWCVAEAHLRIGEIADANFAVFRRDADFRSLIPLSPMDRFPLTDF